MKWALHILSFLMVFQASASPLKLETDYGKIFIPELKQWELGKNMFGMPFIYFSPQENGQRSNISFTYTGVELEIDLELLKKDPEGYKKLKKKWASTVDAKPVKFHEYKKWQNEHGHFVHEVGFDYRFTGKDYFEKSYYINCREHLVYVKSLRLKENEKHQEHFLDLVKQLDCAAI